MGCQKVAFQRDVAVPAVNLLLAEEAGLPLVSAGRCDGHPDDEADAAHKKQNEQNAEKGKGPEIIIVILPVGAAFQGTVDEILNRATLLYSGLEQAFLESHQGYH